MEVQQSFETENTANSPEVKWPTDLSLAMS